MADFEYEYDDQENEEYIRTLRTKIDNHSEDEGEREEIYKELQDIRYNPSNNPRNDAELVFRRAKDRLRQKRVKDPSVKSYLKFMQNEQGLSDAQVKKRYRDLMKGDN